jgi:DUF4097 and DUF4098 domain-containing protein YvlB
MIMKKTFYFLMFSLLIFFTDSGMAAAKEFNKDFHQSFDVKKGDRLSLRFGDGDVKIIPWEKNIIDVNVRYKADINIIGIRLGGKQDFDVEFRQTANTVYVIGKEASSATIGYHNKRIYEYVYEIHSPQYIRLDLDGDDGNVEIEDWAAEIDCRIDDGDILLRNIVGGGTSIRGEDGEVRIENLTADLTIEVDDGDVTLTDCDMGCCRVEGNDGNVTISQSKGSFDIALDDGDVVLENIEAQRLKISTEDGDIEVDHLSAGKLDAEIKTNDGDVKISFDRGFSVSFTISADDADDIRLDLDNIENFEKDRRSTSGSINGGNGRLKIRTDDGNVTIKEK